MGMSEISITDAGIGNTDLTLNGVGVDIVQSGFMIIPSAGKMIDVAMSDFTLGGEISNPANTIGNIYMSGLVLGGNTITISGH